VPSGGSIEFETIDKESDSGVADDNPEALRIEPTEALTQPFHIVGTAKINLEPQLDLTEETVSCE
jgi:hypothetical protein